MSNRAQGIKEVRDYLYTSLEVLRAQKDFSPDNPIITPTLSNLVFNLTQWNDKPIAELIQNDESMASIKHDLPLICGIAECEMEKWWTRRIIGSTQPACEILKSFWYHQQYQNLCNAELNLIRHKKFNKVIFLGSGALPLTAIMLSQHLNNVPIECIDRDRIACNLAYQLINKLGLSNKIQITNSSAENYSFEEGTLVICAALLDSPDVHEAIVNSGVQSLILRDAEGVYNLIYKPANKNIRGFNQVSKTSRSSSRINTSIYFEKVA
jgi:hypothetical protein